MKTAIEPANRHLHLVVIHTMIYPPPMIGWNIPPCKACYAAMCFELVNMKLVGLGNHRPFKKKKVVAIILPFAGCDDFVENILRAHKILSSNCVYQKKSTTSSGHSAKVWSPFLGIVTAPITPPQQIGSVAVFLWKPRKKLAIAGDLVWKFMNYCNLVIDLELPPYPVTVCLKWRFSWDFPIKKTCFMSSWWWLVASILGSQTQDTLVLPHSRHLNQKTLQ